MADEFDMGTPRSSGSFRNSPGSFRNSPKNSPRGDGSGTPRGSPGGSKLRRLASRVTNSNRFGRGGGAGAEEVKGDDDQSVAPPPPEDEEEKPKAPARTRRYTMTAHPELWAGAQRARQEQQQSRGMDDETRLYAATLRKQLAAMTKSVADYDHNLRQPPAPARRFSGGGGGGGGAGFGSGERPQVDDLDDNEYGDEDGGWNNWGDEEVEPEIDPEQFRVRDGEGWLDMKDARRQVFGGRKWRKFFFRIAGTNVSWYKNAGDNTATGTITIDYDTTVEKGDANATHRNPNIKYTFDLTVRDGTVHHFNARDDDEADDWVETFQYIINQCRDAHENVGKADAEDEFNAHHRDPAAEQRARDTALRHQAYGAGLFDGVRGETASFTIQAYDEFDNPALHGGEQFKVTIENNDLHFDITPEDNADGTYSVSYTPTQIGEFELSVTLDDCDIYGSPFKPQIAPAPTSATHCGVTGDGLYVADAGGSTNTFTIIARDQFDSDRGIGGDIFEVNIDGPAAVTSIEDHGNGRYTVSYSVNVNPAELARSGLPSLELSVLLNNEGFAYARPVAGSPFMPRVRVGINTLHAAQAVHESADLPPAAAPAPAAPPVNLHTPAHFAHLMNGGAGMSPAAGNGYAYGSSPMAAAPPAPPASAGGSSMTDAHLAATLNVLRFAQSMQSPATHMTPAPQPNFSMQSPARVQQQQPQQHHAPSPAQAAHDQMMAQQVAELKAAREALAAERAALDNSRKAAAAAEAEAQRRRAAEAESRRQQAAAAAAAPPAFGSAAPAAAPAAAAPITSAFLSSAPPARTAAGAGAGAADGASPSARSAGKTAAATMPDTAPAELCEPEVVAMFDKYKRSLYALFQHYSAGQGGVRRGKFVQLIMDFDLVPTFLMTAELKSIFEAVAKAVSPGVEVKAVRASYPAFLELLGRVALTALSKPTFAPLHPTPVAKVKILLEMWGFGDPRKLAGIRSQTGADAADNAAGIRA